MKFTEEDGHGALRVAAYGSGFIQVGGQRLTTGLILSSRRIITDWGPSSIADLNAEHLQPLLDLEPEVVIIGTGARQILPPPLVWREFMARGVGVEVMDTGAACRTYNILVSEGRHVVAGLLLL